MKLDARCILMTIREIFADMKVDKIFRPTMELGLGNELYICVSEHLSYYDYITHTIPAEQYADLDKEGWREVVLEYMFNPIYNAQQDIRVEEDYDRLMTEFDEIVEDNNEYVERYMMMFGVPEELL